MSNKVLTKIDNKLVSVSPKELGFKDRYDWYHNCYLRSSHWRNLRIELRKIHNEIVGDKCIACSKSKISLDLHHNNYENTYQEILFKDVIFICRKCHNMLYDKAKVKRRINNTDFSNRTLVHADKLDFGWTKEVKLQDSKENVLSDIHSDNVDYGFLVN